MSPEEIDNLYKQFPAPGRKITIQYWCEYTGSMTAGNRGGNKKRTREATVVQKIHNGANSMFTVELEPENKTGKRGRYKLTFLFRDILIGRIKVQGVEG